MAFWAFVDVWLLAAGVLTIVMSLVWRAKNLMINFTISDADLTGASRTGCDPSQPLTLLLS